MLVKKGAEPSGGKPTYPTPGRTVGCTARRRGDMSTAARQGSARSTAGLFGFLSSSVTARGAEKAPQRRGASGAKCAMRAAEKGGGNATHTETIPLPRDKRLSVTQPAPIATSLHKHPTVPPACASTLLLRVVQIRRSMAWGRRRTSGEFHRRSTPSTCSDKHQSTSA